VHQKKSTKETDKERQLLKAMIPILMIHIVMMMRIMIKEMLIVIIAEVVAAVVPLEDQLAQKILS